MFVCFALPCLALRCFALLCFALLRLACLLVCLFACLLVCFFVPLFLCSLFLCLDRFKRQLTMTQGLLACHSQWQLSELMVNLRWGGSLEAPLPSFVHRVPHNGTASFPVRESETTDQLGQNARFACCQLTHASALLGFGPESSDRRATSSGQGSQDPRHR